MLGLGARHEHTRVDAKRSTVKLALAAQIRDRLEAPTPTHEGTQAIELARRERLVSIEDDPHAVDAQRVGDDELGIETWALDASRAKVIGRPLHE